jgi:hypothetical protein
MPWLNLNRRGHVVYEFEALAVYNGEVARGLVHTPEYDRIMATEQQRFYEKTGQEPPECGPNQPMTLTP